MNTRIRRKRGKQAEIERLKRGNAYLAGVIGRMQAEHKTEIQALEYSLDWTTCLLCAAIIEAGGFVKIEVKEVKEWIKEYEISPSAEDDKICIGVRKKSNLE